MNKNYKLIKSQDLKDINSKGTLLEHIKSGARVLLIENDDENKTFCIGFRTPPCDDSGIPHILEHSVLCGSKKYPVKEPFVELMKASLNTFLNAMTFPDKTIYPVSSCNDKDFRNLVDVYMDAVLYPNIYVKENIFKQEGWHYELDSVDGELTINGVVYNEMKGAFSAPDGVIERLTFNALFPDSPYGFESGGDPDFIPSLSYEKFKSFHAKYYHPSNSYIIIYGNCDMDEQIDYLDKEYLSKFDKISVDSEIKEQAPFDCIRYKEAEYQVSKEQGIEKKALMEYGIALPKGLSLEEQYALDTIATVLLQSAGAPIERALLDAGLGSAITGGYDNSIMQPMFTINTKDLDASDKDKFVEVIENTLKKVAKEGINKKSLQAAINVAEFRTREADFGGMSKGLIYGMNSFNTWLYDDNDCFSFAEFDKAFSLLKSKLDTNYYEELIEKYLINNNHKVVCVVKPSYDCSDKKAEQLKEKLQAYKETLSLEEKEALVKATKELKAYQASDDKPEDLATIPLLKKEDLSYDVKPISNIIEDVNGVKVIRHDFNTNGIAYIELNFDCKKIPADLVKYIGFYSTIFYSIDTENHTYEELEQDGLINLGNYGCNIRILEKENDYYSSVYLHGSCVEGKVQYLLDFLKEIVMTSKYAESKNRIKEILDQSVMKMQQGLVYRGNYYAGNRSLSYIDPASYLKDITSGIAYFHNLMDIVKDYDNKFDELVQGLIDFTKYVFTKENLLVSFTGPDNMYDELKAGLASFVDSLEDKQEVTNPFKFVACQKNEGFCAPYDVNYVGFSGNFKDFGVEYNGAFQVFQNALLTDYLWKQVRVLGGAYGVGFNLRRFGQAYFTSYRDPNIEKTLENFKNVLNFIDNFNPTEEDILKYVIGTVGSYDSPLSPRQKGTRSMCVYLQEVDFNDFVKEKKQIIDATKEEMVKIRPVIEAIIKQNNVCTIGNEKKIQETKDIFKNKVALLK